MSRRFQYLTLAATAILLVFEFASPREEQLPLSALIATSYAEQPAMSGSGINYSREVERLASGELSVDKQLEILLFAIEEGTLDSLQLLRPEAIGKLPEYRATILPELKRQSLKSLLVRFSLSDWTNWPRASQGENGGPTVARTFVNDVMMVNTELGSFLETSALLFLWALSNNRRGDAV